MSTPPTIPSLDELSETYETALCRYVTDAAREGTPNLHDAMAYALGTDIADPKLRGKRIRPALCLLTAIALDAKIEHAMPFALAIELMHNFCLVHDDIEDGDTMRRGRESVWKRYGIPHAINIGDYLLVHAERALLYEKGADLDEATRLALLRVLNDALNRTHIGQAMDMNARTSREISVEDYMRITREKTGRYLAAPIQGGAVVAHAAPAVLKNIERMTAVLGPLFQIMDDVIDLTEGKGREAVGSDIREGKRSFMVAHAAERCSKQERERLFEILDRPREKTTEEDVTWGIRFFESQGSLDAAREECRKLLQDGLTIMKKLPPSLSAALRPVFERLSRREK